MQPRGAVSAVAKRSFDILFAGIGLVLSSPILLVIAILIKWESPGPAFFVQERIGRYFKPFLIYKFRTMIHSQQPGAMITIANDRRITRVGRFIRRFKLDELPQLMNVIKGDMSIVGPRPEVRKYVESFRPEYEYLLRVRPGLTDPASIAFFDENMLLAKSEDPEHDYLREILPRKIEYSKRYVEDSSLIGDVGLIFRTLFRVFRKT